MGTTSEAQKRASMKYSKTNIVRVPFDVSRKTEQDILDRLNAAPSRNTYIKELIRQDILNNPHRFQ